MPKYRRKRSEGTVSTDDHATIARGDGMDREPQDRGCDAGVPETGCGQGRMAVHYAGRWGGATAALILGAIDLFWRLPPLDGEQDVLWAATTLLTGPFGYWYFVTVLVMVLVAASRPTTGANAAARFLPNTHRSRTSREITDENHHRAAPRREPR